MFTSRTSPLALLTVLGALLAAAPGASAATQRYASPTGSGTACSAASPCSITEAVKPDYTDDEVIVAPGDYPLTRLSVTGLNVHGVAGQPRPRLLFNPALTPAMQAAGSTLRYLEIDQAPGTQGITLGVSNSSLDQIIARGTGLPGWRTIDTQYNTQIRNSIVTAPGSNGTAIWTWANGVFASGTYRNVTAIAPESGGVAIHADATGAAGYASVLARNVIARGGNGGAGLEVDTHNSGATAKITVGNSNWLGGSTSGTKASIVDGGGNQSAAPAFVSAAGGDYRQAAWSPTIDAGLSEIFDGDFDVEGDPRQISTVDIGADEFVVAPTVTTGPATAVTDHSATLGGSVDGMSAPTSYHFEYGPTTAYGSVTPSADAGYGGVAAAATVGALSPVTIYHYRLVASNAGGVTEGADQTFTTVATAPALPPATTPSSATTTSSTTRKGFAGVKVVSTRLTFSGRFITLRLSCPHGTVGRCLGRTRLTAPGHKTSPITLGRAGFSIAAGKQARVTLRISRAGRRRLSEVEQLRAKDTNAARNGAGVSKTTVAAVTIRRRHR